MKILLYKLLFITSLILLFSFSQEEEYPVPKTKHLLFYIQRNHNANTIVYDANFDADGNLNSKKPIDAYWIRFEEKGQRMELRRFEKWMAYGIKCKKAKNDYDYKANLSASDKIVFWLRQTAPFKAEIFTEINGKIVKLDHLFATLDESGWLPKVIYGEFFGHNSLGKLAYKKVLPKDIK